MQIHTLDKAGIINELQFGTGINHAIHDGRRADFALLLSMFSNDARHITPVEETDSQPVTEQILRQQFALSEPQKLRSDQSSYTISAEQAKQFHRAGLASSKLSHYLIADALAYMPEETFDLPEEVYQNLSGHERRQLAQPNTPLLPEAGLYNQLSTAWAKARLSASV
ncbi:hypothetical protein BOO29_00835 [Vibrio navarrensis]|uniref:Queuosine biosynthesis protein QueD n=1 Tax=Vibrio navarrensis TaxID=29495 RepID=A0A099MNZ3_9VIBR|nr:VC2046/SO_2500 family protein [Vibrio navarrensis]EGR2794486.1 hypothetical protein [Vibrio navarrensis]EJK2116127.1 hypothetical protein [Vibrio navarrensis]EJL6393970.1 hypothetical protein [Vibrio navarrensis]EKA5636263.1 hypothetical protein [Vibrio navarrensis]ELN6931630.1 hypothetical protein [Vibrio navarrensis]